MQLGFFIIIISFQKKIKKTVSDSLYMQYYLCHSYMINFKLLNFTYKLHTKFNYLIKILL